MIIFKACEGYLTKKIGLNEKYVFYYVTWVDSCYRFFNKGKNDLLTGEQQRKFLKYLSKTREDWQICAKGLEFKRIDLEPQELQFEVLTTCGSLGWRDLFV